MQKLRLKQNLTQRLSPQQIQLIKLLQVPSIAMKTYIEAQLAENPLLGEGNDTQPAQETAAETSQEVDIQLQEPLPHEGYQAPTMRSALQLERQRRRDALLATVASLYENLLEQLRFLKLNQRQYQIGQHLIGSIEKDGYLCCDLETIVNDLAFTQGIETTVQEVTAVLKKIQESFDPPGIGARNLQECLLIQLHKSQGGGQVRQLAIQVITQCFDAFTKKHYDKIATKLLINDPQLLKAVLALITKLDPKPGSRSEVVTTRQVLYPDFIVTRQDGQLCVVLNAYNMPALRIRKNYAAMLAAYHKHPPKDKPHQEAASFIKKKLVAAQWFIEALKQRQETLLRTMKAIVMFQHDFFLDEEESKLKPLVLRYIAEEIDMDVSTVSRVVNNKSVQTDFGIYPLKFFFSEAISTTSGEVVSNRTVKQAILALIQGENKQQPYADEQLTRMLCAKGYQVARRTIAKYREQLHIPVARLRKEL